MLTRLVPAVVQAPQFGPLALGIPLSELVPEAVDPLLGSGLLLVAAGAAEQGVKPVVLDGVEQHSGLEPIAGGPGTGLLHRLSGVDGVLDRGHHQPEPVSFHHAVPELDDLGEVVPGVDVHDGERHPSRGEGPDGQMEHDDRVLASGEEKGRALELGRHLPDDEKILVIGHVAVIGQLDTAAVRLRCPLRWQSRNNPSARFGEPMSHG